MLYAARLAQSIKNIVLVVEDEHLVVRMVTMALSMAGYRAAVAENGQVGYEAFVTLRDEICLVLTDVLMPVCNGLEMADRIRALDPKVPILMITGYSDHEMVRTAESRYTVMRKPFLPADLIRRMKSQMQESDSATSGS
jgi:DNA-binding response OmpR family regulator